MEEQSVTAGIAKRIMKETTSCAQTKSGMRSSDMPGARWQKTVAMMQVAPAIEPISTMVTICDQISTRWPGEKPGPDSGVNMNQPMSGPMLKSSAVKSETPAPK